MEWYGEHLQLQKRMASKKLYQAILVQLQWVQNLLPNPSLS